LGEELALQLSRENARLILTARNKEALAEVQKRAGGECYLLPADLEQDDLDQLCGAALKAFGHIDILINNAGVTQRSMAEDTRLEVDRRLMEINFFAPITLTKNLLPHFRARQTGKVVVISSMAGLMGFPLRTSYAAAKHALQGYFETLQVEHTIPGFSALIVSPGRVNTPISLHALTATGEAHNKMDKGQANGIPVEVCGARILAGMRKGKQRVIIARSERLLWGFHKIIPSLYYYIARKVGANQ
jgi:short-subunit dehydrogenase